ncbi:hypothetical protein ACN27F_22820 [Solwaraspora sp. WMMB335]|uniref:hypothetical protein n=1 Tax=Solwaraspora sp. WMMB335 TaxID=3404118 RepID=UPI003B948E9F
MRHLWSFLSGLAVAPVCWLLIAIGQSTSAGTVSGWVADGRFHTAELLVPAAYLLVAGLLLGLLGTLRFSPLGPVTAGLLLITGYVATFVDPFWTRDVIGAPWRLLGEPVDLWPPVANGTLALLGVLLCVAAFSPGRWRSRPGRGDGERTTAEPQAEPLPVRPLGEFDPSLWSLSGGGATPAAPAPSQGERRSTGAAAGSTATDGDGSGAGPDTGVVASGDDGTGPDRLRPARPIPRSTRIPR